MTFAGGCHANTFYTCKKLPTCSVPRVRIGFSGLYGPITILSQVSLLDLGGCVLPKGAGVDSQVWAGTVFCLDTSWSAPAAAHCGTTRQQVGSACHCLRPSSGRMPNKWRKTVFGRFLTTEQGETRTKSSKERTPKACSGGKEHVPQHEHDASSPHYLRTIPRGNVCPACARRATFVLTIPTSARDLPSDGEGPPNEP